MTFDPSVLLPYVLFGLAGWLFSLLVLWLVIYGAVRAALSSHRAAQFDERRAQVYRG